MLFLFVKWSIIFFFFQAEDGIRDLVRSRGLGDVYKRQNQYWLSYYVDGVIYDKKYIFLAGSIEETNFTTIPLMEKRGVMIE